MTKQELVALAKELSLLDNLSGRAADVALLKREFKKFNRESDDDSFADQELADQFNKYFAEIAKHEGNLLANASEEKKSLIEKAKALLNATNFKKASEEMNNLFNEFKACGRCSKEEDDAFWAEFKDIKDKFFEKKKEFYQAMSDKINASKAKKEEIIAKAQEVINLENIKEAGDKLNGLFDEWKAAGFAGKEDDNKLWESFSEIRKAFFEKKKQHNEDMKAVYVARMEQKEAIIAKAKILLANSTFEKEEVESMKNLRNEWKTVGFAGKENDDELWNKFTTVVNKYFDEMKFYKN